MIARQQTVEMPRQFRLALDHDMQPRELSEIVFHLAFYAGRPNAMSAVPVVKGVLDGRG